MLRSRVGSVEFLLVHPGGPFYANRDEGVWSIPKGLVGKGEEPLEAARREFSEETGLRTDHCDFLDLGEIRQQGGKIVRAWAFVGDCDPTQLHSNTFELQWPPRSGRRERFPEVDRAAWLDRAAADRKILPAQRPLLERAVALFRTLS